MLNPAGASAQTHPFVDLTEEQVVYMIRSHQAGVICRGPLEIKRGEELLDALDNAIVEVQKAVRAGEIPEPILRRHPAFGHAT